MLHTNSKIHVAGHRGMVGSAIVRRLVARGFNNLILPTRENLDLTNQASVDAFYAEERPEFVFLAAAKVGGIHANSACPADFIRDNLAIQTNVIHAAWKHGSQKLLFLGSSCIYPRDCAQPIKEDYLLTGPLEPTNQWYAVAKIAGIKMCQAYRRQYGFDAICAMPTNLYGPGDNYHPENSHVVPALIRRFQTAKAVGAPHVDVWGSGKPLREFLYVDDLANALIVLMTRYSESEIINVGSGEETSIETLARIISDEIEYQGNIIFDSSRPDGTHRKLLDSSRMFALGWKPDVELSDGLKKTIRSYIAKIS